MECESTIYGVISKYALSDNRFTVYNLAAKKSQNQRGKH